MLDQQDGGPPQRTRSSISLDRRCARKTREMRELTNESDNSEQESVTASEFPGRSADGNNTVAPVGTGCSSPPKNAPPRIIIDIEELRAIFRTLAGAPMAPPSYSGHDHEDPEVFIRVCEEFFRRQDTSESQEVHTAEKALEGNAEKWWATYKNLPVPWEKFRDLIRTHFNGKQQLMRFNALLFSQVLGDREDVSLFPERRHLLIRRLQPHANETGIVALLGEGVKGSIRRHLRSPAPNNVGIITLVIHSLNLNK